MYGPPDLLRAAAAAVAGVEIPRDHFFSLSSTCWSCDSAGADDESNGIGLCAGCLHHLRGDPGPTNNKELQLDIST
jgi:hypothetical protein